MGLISEFQAQYTDLRGNVAYGLMMVGKFTTVSYLKT